MSENRGQQELGPSTGRRLSVSNPAAQFDESGAGSADSLLSRYGDAFKHAATDNHRLFLASLVLTTLYMLKVLGLRADVVIFGQQVFKLPYGNFFFCLLAQITYSLSVMRGMDARVYDRCLRALCDAKWPENAELMYHSYKGGAEWFSVVQVAATRVKDSPNFSFLYYLTTVPLALSAAPIFFAPILSGAHFCFWSDPAAAEPGAPIQFWSVLIATIASFFLTILYFAMYSVDNDEAQ